MRLDCAEHYRGPLPMKMTVPPLSMVDVLRYRAVLAALPAVAAVKKRTRE